MEIDTELAKMLRETGAEIEKEIVEQAESIGEDVLGTFAENLEAARAFWRKWPQLVESPHFPEDLRQAYARRWNRDVPSDEAWQACTGWGIDPMERDWRQELFLIASRFIERQRQGGAS